MNINTFKKQSKSENELSLSVLTCIRKIVFSAVYELIFSKWFCCIKLDFLCLYKRIKSKLVLVFKSISSRISNKCWINVKNKTRITSLFTSNKIQYVGCKCKISVEINSNVSKMIQANSLLFNFQMKSPCYLVTLLLESSDFQTFLKQYVILVP